MAKRCRHGHKLTPRNLIERDGKQKCRLCHNHRSRKTQALKRNPDLALLPKGKLTYRNAQGANGPKIAAWMDENLPHFDKDSTEARRKWGWRQGDTADFYTVDEIVTKYGKHVSSIPDDVWTDRARGEWSKAATNGQIAPKTCLECGRRIPMMHNGRWVGPKKYSERKYCSQSCCGEAQRKPA